MLGWKWDCVINELDMYVFVNKRKSLVEVVCNICWQVAESYASEGGNFTDWSCELCKVGAYLVEILHVLCIPLKKYPEYHSPGLCLGSPTFPYTRWKFVWIGLLELGTKITFLELG